MNNIQENGSNITESYVWELPDGDAKTLAKLLNIDPASIKAFQTEADEKAPVCDCGRQIGLLDVAKNALDRSVHNEEFFGTFFTKGDLSKVATPEDFVRVIEVKHSVSCFDCNSTQKAKPGWKLSFWK